MTEEVVFNIKPKVKDIEAFQERVKQGRLFDQWCESKGYFGHSKYFEAWLAALEFNKRKPSDG